MVILRLISNAQIQSVRENTGVLTSTQTVENAVLWHGFWTYLEFLSSHLQLYE
jgi:hypothetical protein